MRRRRFTILAALLAFSSEPSSAGVFDLPEPISVTLMFGKYKVTATQIGHDFAPTAVSNQAATVVGYDLNPNSSSTGEGLIWRRGEKTKTVYGYTSSVNWNGQTAVGVERVSEIGEQPYRNDAIVGMKYSDSNGILHPLGGPRVANDVAVSGDGRVVVGVDNIYGAYSWTEGSTPISLPGTAAPKATSFDGSVIAGQIQAFNGQPAKRPLKSCRPAQWRGC